MNNIFQDVVVLFGGPATGKDTVSAVLVARGCGFEHFAKVKVGQGNTNSYSLVDYDQLQKLREAGRIISEINRYGAIYAIDGTRLTERLARGKIPLVHTADVAEVTKLANLGALVVVMECSRETARRRLELRDKATVDQRLSVWDGVAAQLSEILPFAQLLINTEELNPEAVADAIMNATSISSAT